MSHCKLKSLYFCAAEYFSPVTDKILKRPSNATKNVPTLPHVKDPAIYQTSHFD